MIEMIEIIIRNGSFININALISYKYNYCLYNEHKYKINNEFKDNVVRIIRTWKNEYGSSNNIDENEFKVIVTSTNNKKDYFHGKGVYPRGYTQLIDLLGGLDD